MNSPSPQEAHNSSSNDTAMQLSEIQRKLNELKQRREELEQQRRQILGSISNTTSSDLPPPVPRRSEERNRSRYSQRMPPPPPTEHSIRIPSEKERKMSGPRNAHVEMKEAMRRSWSQDSMLVIGDFLLEDKPRTCTFGRERRFLPLRERPELYYLGTDMELMIRNKNVKPPTRGEIAKNPAYHWYTCACHGTPGPGAYTPRYSKVTKPTRRT
uniref:WGS project CAEQ00000000 data, annotated contig 2224 n=1 Tax=Trypanosoma congolense (strain IL3000) TaxID=1068625 RepID=F9WCF3_TRYCI|nr:unnamed protein product [Trypanosoma congolense IL3000]